MFRCSTQVARFAPTRFAARNVLFLRAQSSNAVNRAQLPFTFSSSGPSAIKYTSQHEWIAAHPDGTAFVGITKYAADALGDATYVELPEAESELEAGDSLGSVESVKSASEIYQPVGGVVLEGNEALNDSPQLINEDPLGEGWIAKVKLNNVADLETDELMSLEQYEKSLQEDH
ncbi:LAMI_0F05336g1_1 [Lachancea mirantina]|uniref:Glycine cleavage system H protein n=1 Tax=Lachancea mirantina TaxID=1230905 RepID=A0A1G4JY72_9SACH|nr:LAMI_0F05336g1_1 [Lachancea mirantina]